MRTPTLTIIAVGMLAGIAASATSISTGVAPWQVNGNPAVVEPSIPSNYIPNFGDGNWVSTTASGVVAPGTYTFTLDLGALLGGAGVLTLQYGADNSVTWSVTNGSLAGTTSCLNGGGDCFGSVQGAPRPLTGTFGANSVLTAVVVNDGGTLNPMSLLAVGTADVVPEPSTFALCVLGGLAMLARRRR